jgi:P-type Cu+ transporter
MSEKETKTSRAVFAVRGADCVMCALAIEKQVKKVEGVKDVKSAIMLNEVFVDYDESKVNISEINEAIRKTGYSNHLVRKTP